MVAERSPEHATVLIEIGMIFEEIAYADSDPSQERTQTYYDRIKKVTSQRMQEPSAAA